MHPGPHPIRVISIVLSIIVLFCLQLKVYFIYFFADVESSTWNISLTSLSTEVAWTAECFWHFLWDFLGISNTCKLFCCNCESPWVRFNCKVLRTQCWVSFWHPVQTWHRWYQPLNSLWMGYGCNNIIQQLQAFQATAKGSCHCTEQYFYSSYSGVIKIAWMEEGAGGSMVRGDWKKTPREDRKCTVKNSDHWRPLWMGSIECLSETNWALLAVSDQWGYESSLWMPNFWGSLEAGRGGQWVQAIAGTGSKLFHVLHW